MNSIVAFVSKSLANRRFAGLVLAASLGLFLGASTVHACAVPYKSPASPKIPFVSQPDDDNWRGPATIVGLWHLTYTATYSTPGPLPVPVVPPGSFPFLESY